MEKKWLYVGGGFLAGVVVTFLVLFLISLKLTQESGRGLPGATLFNSAGQVIDASAFKVLQVIEDDAALVHAKSGISSYTGEERFNGVLYLIINDDGQYYYDDQIIRVPYNKEVRHIGVYKYTAGSGYEKTVPIIAIYNK